MNNKRKRRYVNPFYCMKELRFDRMFGLCRESESPVRNGHSDDGGSDGERVQRRNWRENERGRDDRGTFPRFRDHRRDDRRYSSHRYSDRGRDGSRRDDHRDERKRKAEGDEGVDENADPKLEAEKLAKRAKKNDDVNTRTGGAYIPPARLRQMQAEITDKGSQPYQRIAWEALKKSLNGLINKVNVSNIKDIVHELFQENIVRGRFVLD